jgi:hypothetical protein
MASSEIVNWEAQEYIARDRNGGWYVGLFVVAAAASALAIWLMGWGSWSFIALIVVSVVALMVYTKRPPRMLHYSLSDKGLSEGNKLYDFGQFKAFGVLNDGPHFSIVLIPRKRFSPRVSVYFPEAQGEEIVDMFGDRLPMENVKLDMIDKMVRFLRI